MITSFEVYAVMQLDSINITAGIIFGVTLFASIVTGVICHLEDGAHIKSAFKRLVMVCAAMAFLLAFLPSSKTAATMIILPAITSDKVVMPVAAEARELYDLAKKALSNLADDKKTAPSK